MNKLNTADNGGMPFEEDDIRWWDAGYRDAFKGLISFLDLNVGLSGLTKTIDGSNMLTVSEGYVALDGEILHVPATTTPIDLTALPFVYLELGVSYDATGLELFEDNTQKDTYEIRKGVVNGYASAQAGLVSLDTLLGSNSAKTIINNFILDRTHEFTACQSFGQNTTDANAIAPGHNYLTMSASSANSFNVNIDNANTDIKRFASGFPNGTFIVVNFTGASGKKVDIIDGTGSSKPIITRGAKKFRFLPGEAALFVVMDANYRLVAGGSEVGTWSNITPNAAESWASTAPLARYRKDGNRVQLSGFIYSTAHQSITSPGSLAFTLPDGFRPSAKETFDLSQISQPDSLTGQPLGYFMTMSIDTNGECNICGNRVDTGQLQGFLSSVSFIVD